MCIITTIITTGTCSATTNVVTVAFVFRHDVTRERTEDRG